MNWDILIRPQKKWFDFKLKELWKFRDLIILFVRRDFVAFYKQTILGPLWFLIQPILTTIVFTIFFGTIAKIPTPGVPQSLFYLSGIVNWNYFADCLTKTSNTFTANTTIFGKVYFPRLIIPISVVISGLITYSIQLLLFIAMLSYNLATTNLTIHFNSTIFIFPIIIAQMALLGLGFGIIVSSLTTKYKDLSFLVTFGIQLWMYATPIVYPMSRVPLKWKWLFNLNPMASVVEMFRNMFFDLNAVNWTQFGYSWLATILVLLTGIILFNRVEKSFMDTV